MAAATDVECLALGEQWVAHGPKVVEYVKRLRHEREWINERILFLHEKWAEERAALQASSKVKAQAYEEAVGCFFCTLHDHQVYRSCI